MDWSQPNNCLLAGLGEVIIKAAEKKKDYYYDYNTTTVISITATEAKTHINSSFALFIWSFYIVCLCVAAGYFRNKKKDDYTKVNDNLNSKERILFSKKVMYIPPPVAEYK